MEPQRECPNCSRNFGQGIGCQYCGQMEEMPEGILLTSSGKRLGSFVLEIPLMLITNIVPFLWLVWTFYVFSKGQTPAKQVLGMRVVRLRTQLKANWGTMFVRGILALLVIIFLTPLTFGIILLWPLWDAKNQQLWDKMLGTIVVEDPEGKIVE